MTRRLLPYEHDLIEALGVSKEEYLEFIALQAVYKDVKEGTQLDIRNWDIVAIVLTVIGIIFQVVAALLAQPTLPTAAEGQRQTREQRFSPRFGFNSTQEIAKYGDVVPLVYTDRTVNSNGGVRISGALLWSAVQSYGSNQLLQMLLMLAGGAIKAIDPTKTAFGQTGVDDLTFQNRWIYFNPNATGTVAFENEVNSSYESDPTKYGQPTDNPYRLQTTLEKNQRVDGFSQVYSPSSSNNFGGYSPVPVGVKLYLRDGTGKKRSIALGVDASDLAQWVSGDRLSPISVGDKLSIVIASTKDAPLGTKFADDLARSAIDARRGLASSFDDAGIFKLGSAKFKIKQIIGTSTDEGDFRVETICIEAGHSSSIAYSTDEVSDVYNDYKDTSDYRESKKTFDALIALDHRNDVDNKLIQQLPTDQRFAVKTPDDLIKSKQIWQIVPQKIPSPGGSRVQPPAYSYVFKYVRDITNEELDLLGVYSDFLEFQRTGADNFYYLKVFARYEEASYTTLSPCSIVNFSLQCQLFRRISGRQRKYGSKEYAGYLESDNGIQHRTALFLLKYKKPSEQEWTYVPGIFAVRRAAEQDNFIYVKFVAATAEISHWQFKFEAVVDPVSEVKTYGSKLRNSSGRVSYFYLQNSGDNALIELSDGRQIHYTGFMREALGSTLDAMPPINESPSKTNEWDWFSLDADTQLSTSFERGPEFSITAVTEQQQLSFGASLYKNLSLVGFNIFSGKNLQDMRALSVFATEGKPVRLLQDDGSFPSTPDGPTCFAPDIFLDTVIDETDGIGHYAIPNTAALVNASAEVYREQLASININQLAISKKFCRANNLFMDCLIADRGSWREFWASTAPFSLLEFARIDGQETLIPAVPYDPSTFKISQKINISALFNQGNILEDTYKEEFLDFGSSVQDIIASVVYRSLDADGIFAINKTISVQLNDTSENDAIRETFDLSAFVTNESQAIMYGMLLCNLRRYVRSGIEFKTFPTATPVSPGAYIYVDIGLNAWDGIKTGIVEKNGVLNTPLDNSIPDKEYSVLLYKSSSGVVGLNDVLITNNASANLSAYEGWLFVLGERTNQKRVYRISDAEMDEEGEVTIRATIFPCDLNGNALIADFNPNNFTVIS
jgi:hypothetical protein